MFENEENFTKDEINILNHYVTNTDRSIFALTSLPEVVKGALFSRYSRSNSGLRRLLLKEYSDFNISDFSDKQSNDAKDQERAVQKAKSFYDRVLDGYGDDSIGELGGAHIAMENVSILATKLIEDARIGGSPLEKSTRYIYFDQKVGGDYRFLKEEKLMSSTFKNLYCDTCRSLFETYSKLVAPLTDYIKTLMPYDENISKRAYEASLRAKVCDLLRGLLPASTLTNLGLFGNGRFFEYLIQKMKISPIKEIQESGDLVFQKLSKVIPSFVRKGESTHKHFQSFKEFSHLMNEKRSSYALRIEQMESPSLDFVKLIDHDKQAYIKVASALLYEYSKESLYDIITQIQGWDENDIKELIDDLSSYRGNRRHKLSRALEHAEYTFDLLGDYGMFRDLHRHRILTQERQLLTTDYGYITPQEIIDSGLLEDYEGAMNQAQKAYDAIRQDYPYEAQYVVPLAYRLRWYFKINLRSLIWMTELRSAPQGHTEYRKMAQLMAKEVMRVHPVFSSLFKFVDFGNYELGRLNQETKIDQKKGTS